MRWQASSMDIMVICGRRQRDIEYCALKANNFSDYVHRHSYDKYTGHQGHDWEDVESNMVWQGLGKQIGC